MKWNAQQSRIDWRCEYRSQIVSTPSTSSPLVFTTRTTDRFAPSTASTSAPLIHTGVYEFTTRTTDRFAPTTASAAEPLIHTGIYEFTTRTIPNRG